MNLVLLSGGSGKRLWPLSNEIRSKQFIRIFRCSDGTHESMVQRIFRQIKKSEPDATITIATSKTQVSAIHNQLGNEVGVCVEPCRCDTFPAIALSAVYLYEIKHIDRDEPIVVCPIDSYVEDDYFEALKELSKQAARGESNLMLMGIEPTYPSEKYGYIIPYDKNCISPVKTFKEKPTFDMASKYISQGALWNGGVFAFKLGYLLDKAHEIIDFTDYADLLKKYATLDKISFDYAVAEKEKSIKVMRFSGQWKDLGTWNTLTEEMEEKIIGEGAMNDTCKNVHILNEMDVPVLCMGLKDVIVSASAEGILVSDKAQSSYIKSFVDRFNSPIKFAEKSWGSYKVLDVENAGIIVKVTLNPGHAMNYHNHASRDEIWNVLSGNGRVILDGVERSVKQGDVITMAAGCKHTIIADTELKVIEVQIGKDIDVKDKKKFDIPRSEL